MNTFVIAYALLAGVFVLTVWTLLFAYEIARRATSSRRAVVAALARLRDRKIRAAAKKWHVGTETGFLRQRDLMEAALAPMRARKFARGGEVQQGFRADDSLRFTNSPATWTYTCHRRRCRFAVTGEILTAPRDDPFFQSVRDHVATHRLYPRTDQS